MAQIRINLGRSTTDTALQDCQKYVTQLRQMFGAPPAGARYVIRSDTAGVNVVLRFDDRDLEAYMYALLAAEYAAITGQGSIVLPQPSGESTINPRINEVSVMMVPTRWPMFPLLPLTRGKETAVAMFVPTLAFGELALMDGANVFNIDTKPHVAEILTAFEIYDAGWRIN